MTFPHWRFFESVDDELHTLSRVVEFAEHNYPAYSVHIARLYLSVCSEIDVTAKLLCKQINEHSNAGNIDQYRQLIAPKFPGFAELKIELPDHAIDFQPWKAWKANDNPKWWKSYNGVKHERNKFFRDANIGNLLEASAGLLVMLVYLHQEELYSKTAKIQPSFRVMRIEGRYASVIRWGFDYRLPDFGKSHKP